MTTDRIKRLWARLHSIYGHRWASQHGGETGALALEEWRSGLSGLSDEQIIRGIERCRTADGDGEGWPPTLPQFRGWCIGLPTDDEAVALLMRGESPDALTQAVIKAVDPYARKTYSAKALERLYRMHLGRMRQGAEQRVVGQCERKALPPPPAPARAPEPAARPTAREPSRNISITELSEQWVRYAHSLGINIARMTLLQIQQQCDIVEAGGPRHAVPWADEDPIPSVEALFAKTLAETTARVRQRYGDDPRGGYKDFLDQCEACEMPWMREHFTRAEA